MSDTQEGYRFSAQQQRLWQDTGGTAVAQALLFLDGTPTEPGLRAAFGRIIDWHEILRTSYHRLSGTALPVQVVDEASEEAATWSFHDLSRLPAEERRAALESLVEAEREKPIDIGGPAMARFTFATLEARRHALAITLPALSADHVTFVNMARELAGEYGALAPLARDVLQYSQYAEWQRRVADSAEFGADGALVTDVAETAGATFPLQSYRPRDSARQGVHTMSLPNVSPGALDRAATRHEVSPRAICLAAWFVLLWRITGRSEPIVGALCSGRGYEELADAMGSYAKWLGMRVAVHGDKPFASLADEVERSLVAAESSEKYVLGTYARGHDRWQTTFELHRTERFEGPNLTVSLARTTVAGEPSDLRLSCTLSEEATTVTLRYREDRFEAGYPPHLLAQYGAVLSRLLAAPFDAIDAVSLTPKDDVRGTVAVADAAAVTDGPPDRTFPRLFEEQAARTPDASAVYAEDDELTYHELNRRAENLARTLHDRGIGPESAVAVCLEHSAALVVALLGTLKAGAAYVPIEPSLPRRRMDLLLEQLDQPLLITDRRIGERIDGSGGRVLIDEVATDVATTGTPVRADVMPENLAYVIFTSGSTGTPKGVMVPHRALANYLRWSGDMYDAGGTGAAVQSSIAFDLTITSLLGPLLRGHQVRLRRAWQDIRTLADELTRTEKLNLIKITPSHLEIINRCIPPDALADVTGALVVGGEPLAGELVAPWQIGAPETRIFNEYGPTEATVGCSVHEVGYDDIDEATISIGSPLGNCEMYVLDTRLRPVPVGVTGEVYIGGPCLARGYRGNPALTAERFVAHPFASEPGRRLYRTGDLACRRPDGSLRFLGRVDDQIKVRGVRVEPGEIRAALTGHPAISDAIPRLIDVHGRKPFLAAYLIASGSTELSDADLRTYLECRLPPYMIPEAFAWIGEFPLTTNGKLDVRALPPVHASPGRTAGGVAPPRNDVEERLVKILADLLGRDRVSVDENFFDLGGHSILAVQFIAKINDVFGADLDVSGLFEAPEDAPDGSSPASTAVSSGNVVPGSVESLARLLGRSHAVERHDCLVRLGRRDADRAMFCVPPAGGDVSGFRDLAEALADRQTVYALHPPPLEHPDAEQSIAYLADRYLESVKRVRPKGPYTLLGWSAGGLIAFEMARKLRSSGERITLLALVESHPGAVRSDRDETRTLLDFALELGRANRVDLSISPAELTARSREENIEHVLDRAVDAGLISADSERRDLRERLHLYRAHLRAADGYAPGDYNGPALLVQAAQQDAALRAAAARGWRACVGALDVRVLDGDHFSIMRRPHVGQLVRFLTEQTGD